MGVNNPKWVGWFDELDEADKRTVALAALERLFELKEVNFVSPSDPQWHPSGLKRPAGINWRSNGESLLIPF